MRVLRRCWFVAVRILLTTTVVFTIWASQDTEALLKIPLPSQDPWYIPPANLRNFELGAVLRTREINASFFGLVPRKVLAWQLLYRTQAIDGTAIAATTTVFQPSQPKQNVFLSYQTAYNSACPNSVPSYDWRLGTGSVLRPHDHLETTVEFIRIQGYLVQGYIVSSPDHEGPDSAFTAGRVGAKCVLDNMRAVSKFGRTQGLFTTTPAIVGVGYSGGGIPTSWAAALQRNYAPELPVKGWAFGGFPCNTSESMTLTSNSSLSGLVFSGFVGLMSRTAYRAQLKPLWDRIATNEGIQMVKYVRSHGLLSNVRKYRHASLFSDRFQNLGLSLLHTPEVRPILQDNFIGLRPDETPMAPVLLYHGRDDRVVPVAQISSLTDTWCRRKASVTFTTYPGEHMAVSMLGIPGAYRFVSKAFAGKVGTACSRNHIRSSKWSLRGLSTALKPVMANLTTYLNPARRLDREHPPGISKSFE
ncbi:secreted lipase 1 precursor [Myriangium duriaei CBS 260.36]|uniref:Secreted lipase 1 n=1 Tax=Myriangium duriaei CBS 260.36 TaxID=1168546 RepID=A0A9P4J2D9_9PEZI|nr:secreted lipase 1 precursor [Myriangium duriaei CBS 260.36]